MLCVYMLYPWSMCIFYSVVKFEYDYQDELVKSLHILDVLLCMWYWRNMSSRFSNNSEANTKITWPMFSYLEKILSEKNIIWNYRQNSSKYTKGSRYRTYCLSKRMLQNYYKILVLLEKWTIFSKELTLGSQWNIMTNT